MSGAFEDWFENKLDILIVILATEFSWLEELKRKDERRLGGSHVTFMAWTTLIFVALAYVVGWKWINLLAFANYLQVVIAEWPPKGRRIDWITRSAGWALSIPFAILGLIFG